MHAHLTWRSLHLLEGKRLLRKRKSKREGVLVTCGARWSCRHEHSGPGARQVAAGTQEMLVLHAAVSLHASTCMRMMHSDVKRTMHMAVNLWCKGVDEPQPLQHIRMARSIEQELPTLCILTIPAFASRQRSLRASKQPLHSGSMQRSGTCRH